MLDRQTPVEAALFGARQAHLRAHARLLAHAVEAAHVDGAFGRLHERRDYLRERSLARAVAPYEPEDFALSDFERDVVQGLDRRGLLHAQESARARERDGVGLRDVLNRDGGAHLLRWRGSRYSRRPSPRKLKARTVSAIAMPGTSIACGARCNVARSRASSSITPQEGAGGGTPSPRNE